MHPVNKVKSNTDWSHSQATHIYQPSPTPLLQILVLAVKVCVTDTLKCRSRQVFRKEQSAGFKNSGYVCHLSVYTFVCLFMSKPCSLGLMYGQSWTFRRPYKNILLLHIHEVTIKKKEKEKQFPNINSLKQNKKAWGKEGTPCRMIYNLNIFVGFASVPERLKIR